MWFPAHVDVSMLALFQLTSKNSTVSAAAQAMAQASWLYLWDGSGENMYKYYHSSFLYLTLILCWSTDQSSVFSTSPLSVYPGGWVRLYPVEWEPYWYPGSGYFICWCLETCSILATGKISFLTHLLVNRLGIVVYTRILTWVKDTLFF